MKWQLADPNQADYYWHNFRQVIHWVEEHHQHLMSQALQQAVTDFSALSDNAQKLWVRLFSRRGEWFRRDRINYTEIDVTDALVELEHQHWLVTSTPPFEANALRLMTKVELLTSVGQSQRAQLQKLPKDEVVEHLAGQSLPLPCPIFQLQMQGVFEQLSLLFFGNRYQHLNEFVIAALGHVQHERYTIHPHAVFQSASDVELFTWIEQQRDNFKQLTATTDKKACAEEFLQALKHTQVPALFSGKLSRVINHIGRELERQHLPELAMDLYRRSERTPARERLARLLHKYGEPRACQQLLTNMHSAPWDRPEQQVAEQLLRRWYQAPLDAAPTPTTSTLHLDFPHKQVEKATLSHFQTLGWSGSFTENLIPQTLFGLCHWDIIFADIEGAFIHPFQRGPRDLTSRQFFPQRESLFQRRWQQLCDHPQHVMQQIAALASQKHGINNPFVPWKIFNIEWLDWLLRLTPQQWVSIFAQMAFDIKNNRSGFPDLWLYKDSGEVKLVEVKGPGDKLRPNQQNWLNDLQHTAVNVEVAKVIKRDG